MKSLLWPAQAASRGVGLQSIRSIPTHKQAKTSGTPGPRVPTCNRLTFYITHTFLVAPCPTVSKLLFYNQALPTPTFTLTGSLHRERKLETLRKKEVDNISEYLTRKEDRIGKKKNKNKEPDNGHTAMDDSSLEKTEENEAKRPKLELTSWSDQANKVETLAKGNDEIKFNSRITKATAECVAVSVLSNFCYRSMNNWQGNWFVSSISNVESKNTRCLSLVNKTPGDDNVLPVKCCTWF